MRGVTKKTAQKLKRILQSIRQTRYREPRFITYTTAKQFIRWAKQEGLYLAQPKKWRHLSAHKFQDPMPGGFDWVIIARKGESWVGPSHGY